MECRRASLLAHGHLQHGFVDVLQEIRNRPAWNASGYRYVRHIRARYIEPEPWLRHGMERCRCCCALDFVGSNWRQARNRRELGRNGEISRCDSVREPKLFVEEKLWHTVCRLARPGGRNTGGSDCDGLLGV